MRYSISLSALLLATAVLAAETTTDTTAESETEHYGHSHSNDYHNDDDSYDNYGRGNYRDYLKDQGAHEPSYDEPFARGPVHVAHLKFAHRQEKARAGGEFGLEEHEPIPHKQFFDYRDYDPYYYGDGDRFADCVWPKDQLQLDTPEYQNLSAKCKEEVIWQNILMDSVREKFFTGNGFQSLFDQDMNNSYDTISDSMPVGR